MSLFSGEWWADVQSNTLAGVLSAAVIALAVAMYRRGWHRKSEPQLSGLPSLTLAEIAAEAERAPPAQVGERMRQFIDISVTWQLRFTDYFDRPTTGLSFQGQFRDETTPQEVAQKILLCASPAKLEIGKPLAPDISWYVTAYVDAARYPDLQRLHRDHAITLSGRIKKIERKSVELTDVTVSFGS